VSFPYQKVRSCSNSDVELSGEHLIFDVMVIFLLHDVMCLDFTV